VIVKTPAQVLKDALAVSDRTFAVADTVYGWHAYAELISAARIALMEMEELYKPPTWPAKLRDLADQWSAYKPTSDNSYGMGVKDGVTLAADDLLGWLEANA
jgi:hypothetical protein